MLFQNIKNQSNEFKFCFTTYFTVYTILSQYTITKKCCNKCLVYLHGCCILKSRVLTPHWMVLQNSRCYKPKPLITGKFVDLTSPLYTGIKGEWKDKTLELQGAIADLSFIEPSHTIVSTVLVKLFVTYCLYILLASRLSMHSWKNLSGLSRNARR